MKKTNFTNSHLAGGAKAIRRLGFIAACLAITSLVGLSQANAQTVDQLSEQAVAHVKHLFQEETNALEMEYKTQPGIIAVESNLLLADYYNRAYRTWVRDEVDFKDALKINLGLITEGSSNGNENFTTASGSAHFGEPFIDDAETKQVRDEIDQIELDDHSNQDILDFFDYLRTLKNS